jgi:hypothetical protein
MRAEPWKPAACFWKALFLFAVLGLPAAAPGAEGDNQPATPAQQYQALIKEYQTAASSAVVSDEERRKTIERVESLRESLSQRFLALAEKYRADPIAVDALLQAVWMINHSVQPAGKKDSPSDRAMALLLRDYLPNAKLGPICQRITAGCAREYETFLRTVLEKSPHKEARGLACLSLAQNLNNRRLRLDQIRDRPELGAHFAVLFGKEFFKKLQRQDRAALAGEVERLLEQAAELYDAVTIPYAGTVGAKARAELFELQNLFVGREAPEIESEDQEGRRFKLSDYRGKVVLLDFWNKF